MPLIGYLPAAHSGGQVHIITAHGEQTSAAHAHRPVTDNIIQDFGSDGIPMFLHELDSELRDVADSVRLLGGEKIV